MRIVLPGALCLVMLSLPARAAAQHNEQSAKSAPTKSASATPTSDAPAEQNLQGEPQVAVAPERFTMPNGLKVVLTRDPRRPRVALTVTYDVGSRDDPPGYRGLAHLVEHLMFEGMAKVNGLSFAELVESEGATEINGATSPDHTIYFQVLPASQLELALWAEASRMALLLSWIGEPELKRARTAVVQEWEENVGSGLIRPLNDYLYSALYPESHPYHAFNDDPDDVQAITLANVQWFFQQHYAPNNATVSVAGDLDPVLVRQMVEKYFGPVASKSAPDTAITKATLSAKHTLDVLWLSKRRACWIAWLIDPMPKERRALDVLSSSLDLELDRLEHEEGLAWGSAQYDERELGGVFTVRFGLEEGAELDAWQARVDTMIKKAGREPVSLHQLARAKTPWVQDQYFARENLLRVNALWTQAGGGDPSPSFEEAANEYAAVSANDLMSAAQQWLATDRRVVMCTRYRADATRIGRLKRHRIEEVKR